MIVTISQEYFVINENLSKKDKKDKVDNIILEIKTRISNDFDVKKLKEKAPLLHKISTKILEKFGR